LQGVAVSVCVEASNVAEVYAHWVSAALPGALPEALRELFDVEESQDGPAHAAAEDVSSSAFALRIQHTSPGEEVKLILDERWKTSRCISKKRERLILCAGTYSWIPSI
jgi:hypothetical protein